MALEHLLFASFGVLVSIPLLLTYSSNRRVSNLKLAIGFFYMIYLAIEMGCFLIGQGIADFLSEMIPILGELSDILDTLLDYVVFCICADGVFFIAMKFTTFFFQINRRDATSHTMKNDLALLNMVAIAFAIWYWVSVKELSFATVAAIKLAGDIIDGLLKDKPDFLKSFTDVSGAVYGWVMALGLILYIEIQMESGWLPLAVFFVTYLMVMGIFCIIQMRKNRSELGYIKRKR